MTSTELIATKLFGWERVKPTREDPKVYEHSTGSTAYVGGDLDGAGCGPIGGEDWPDLTDWNWIRRMEDVLAERQMLMAYMMALTEAYDTEFSGDGPLPGTLAMFLRATAAQRVAAAVKVLEGQAELEREARTE